MTWKVARGDEQVPGKGTPVHAVSTGTSTPQNAESPEQPDDAADTVDATDAAVKRASELDVDLTEVQGSGKDGRVTADDVESAAETSD